jgi:hypothetical protein
MKEDKLKNFLDNKEEVKHSNEEFDIDGEQTISQKDGLIERVDVKFVTKEGKQLLKEQLFERS